MTLSDTFSLFEKMKHPCHTVSVRVRGRIDHVWSVSSRVTGAIPDLNLPDPQHVAIFGLSQWLCLALSVSGRMDLYLH